jgi:hypothetical protein
MFGVKAGGLRQQTPAPSTATGLNPRGGRCIFPSEIYTPEITAQAAVTPFVGVPARSLCVQCSFRTACAHFRLGLDWPHESGGGKRCAASIVALFHPRWGKVMSVILWLLALAAGFWFYTDYQASGNLTGKAYYEACWELKTKTVGFTDPTPSTPYQAGQWKQCEPVAQRALFASGLIFAGRESGEDYDRLRRACPDQYSEVPMGGIFHLYVKDTETEGGVRGIDSFLPATWSLSHWAAMRWPRCNDERERQGFPKIIEKNDGTFAWEKPCPKCK